MSAEPSIVFCSTCKGRTQHLEQTLPRNLADNESYPNCKFLVLDYNSGDNLLDYLRDTHAAAISGGRLVVYSFREPVPFRMAHAKNMAHRLGILEGAGILVNLDADNFTGPGFAEYVAERFEGGDVFLWANRNQPAPERYPKGCNGRIAVSARAFLKTGGYDEAKYNTWGPDDKDFHFRLRRFGYEPREIARPYLEVILHSDKMRFKEYQHVQTAIQDEDFQLVDDFATIANFGAIGLGTVYRNFSAEPIEIKPLPTRIFGIGMHKTGTTSLHTALQILGFDSGHWENAHWAKAIWREMTEEGKSATLERHYALSDLPIPLLYKELDAAYPGSKFILTVRSERKWIESVRLHWSSDHNRFKGQWDTDPFTHKVHKLLYGQKGFNEELFLFKFNWHNAEVLEYFKDRPGDLLIMDMDAGCGWPELCGFLRKPIPDQPYPSALATRLLKEKQCRKRKRRSIWMTSRERR